MINILPNNDLKAHTEDNTCDCKPKVIYENGEMIVIHNSYDKREQFEMLPEEDRLLLEQDLTTEETIISNTDYFVRLVKDGKITLDELEQFLENYILEEEFECAQSVRDAKIILKNI